MKTIKLTVNKASYSASLYVEGLDLNCPMCGVLVCSGQLHYCQNDRPAEGPKPKKARREDGGEK